MDYHRMRYFLVVAEELHFRKAAQRLQLTPSPLSKQIKAFEREMGGELFVRHYHDVALTALGRALVEPVRQILAQVAELETIAEHVGARPAALMVGASALAPAPLLDEFADAAAKLEPAGRVQLCGSSQDLANRVASGELDLALVHAPIGDHGLDLAHWAHDRLALALRADDPLAARDRVDLADVAERDLIVFAEESNSPMREWLTDQLAQRGGARVGHLSDATSDVEAAARVRHEGVVALIGTAPGSTLERVFAPPDYAIRPIAGDPLRVELQIAWSPVRFAQRPRLRRAVEALRRTCRCDDPLLTRVA